MIVRLTQKYFLPPYSLCFIGFPGTGIIAITIELQEIH